MRRRDALRAGAALLGVGALPALGTRRSTAHPGPYQPYGAVDLEGAKEAVVSADGRTAYVATTTGYATVDVSTPDRPTVLADVRDPLADRERGPLRGIQDVTVDGDRLLVAGPANTRPGALAGLLVVDVADPAAPRDLAFYGTDYPIHNCVLADGYAYLTGNDGDENPLVILDVRDAGSGSGSGSGSGPASGDDGGIDVAGRWSLVDHDARWSVVSPRLRWLHDVWVHDGLAYLALWDAGTWILDVSDPSSPAAVGHVSDYALGDLLSVPGDDARRESTELPGNHHYVATDEAGDLLAVGREAWVVRRADADSESGDGDRASTESGDGASVRPSGTAPSGPRVDRGGPGGIDLYDVSDPAAPTLRSRIDPPPTGNPTFAGTWTTAHNFELRDGRLYSSWYQGGVKRHDVSDPATPEELTWWREPTEARFWTARLAVPGADGFFVASSMGVGDVPARVYTFPDHAGVQADPPSLGGDRDAGGTGDDGPDLLTPSGTPTPTAVDGSGSGGSAADGSGADGAPSSAGSVPGFGAGLAAGGGALGVGWWLRRRRRRDRE
jgi:hypothetical protein